MPLGWIATITLLAQSGLWMQDGPPVEWRPPTLPRDAISTWEPQPEEARQPWHDAGLRLFRMPAAVPGSFLTPEPENQETGSFDELRSPGRFQFNMAADNPYIDFRRQAEPGGVGFSRLQSQIVLMEGETLGLVMGLNAVTPAGLATGGLRDGPTVLSPNLTWVWTITDSTAMQGYVGKHMFRRDAADDDLHYGFSFQRPVADDGSVHLFVQALSTNRLQTKIGQAFEWLPGVHWRTNHRSWLMIGVLVGNRREDHGGQFTCSFQF